MKKKLLFLITQSELGGAQRWLFDTATNLDKSRFETIVAAPRGSLSDRLKHSGIKTRVIKNFQRNINPLSDIFAFFEIYSLLKKEQPDILQLCSSKAGFLGAIAGRLAGVKKIFYRIGGWAFNDPRPAWQNKIILWLEKISAPLKDKIIVNSKNNFEQAISLKICPKEKLVLLYNGIKITKNQKTRTKQIPITNDQITIATIANDYPAKGLKYLYQALELLKLQLSTSDFQLLVIGKGSAVGPKDNPWHYLLEQGVDIFVIPSVKEGVPYVLLEAMAAGLPIVATTVGGIPEIIEDGQTGLLVPSKNPAKLAAAIERLINDLQLRNKLGNNARIEVEKYSLEKMVNQYQQLLLL